MVCRSRPKFPVSLCMPVIWNVCTVLNKNALTAIRVIIQNSTTEDFTVKSAFSFVTADVWFCDSDVMPVCYMQLNQCSPHNGTGPSQSLRNPAEQLGT